MSIILSKPPPVNLADFPGQHLVFSMDNPKLIRLLELSIDHLALLYAISDNYNKARDLETVSGKHRATTLKYLDELKDKGLVKVQIDPATKKKYRPTNLYYLSSGISQQHIQDVAKSKGVKIHQLVKDRLNREDDQLTPRPESRSTESLDSEKMIVDDSPASPENTYRQADDMKTRESFETAVTTVLDKLAREVAELKGRIVKLENSTKDQSTFNPDDILSILEDSNKD